MSQRLAKRILLVGWDAADWKILRPLLDAGQMPALASLIKRGCSGNIATLNPPLSPILWSSIVTGKWPFKHGIQGFLEPIEEPPGVRPVSSTSRTSKALWNICHQAGLRTHAIGFWASHPAEPIRGVCISDQFPANPPEDPAADWPLPPESVHPENARESFGDLRVHPADIGDDNLRYFIPGLDSIDRTSDPRPAQLAEALAKAGSYQAALMKVLSEEPWDFLAVYFELIDVVGHHFMPFHPPRLPSIDQRDFQLYQHVVRNVYLFQDMMLASVLKVVGEDTTVIVVSDHGFHSDHQRPVQPPAPEAQEGQIAAAPDSLWHRPLGMLCMAGPHIKVQDSVYGASLLDITPTVLTMLGLPVGKDMDGKVLGAAFTEPPQIERIESWDTLEGDAGLHPVDKRHQAFDHAASLEHLVALGYVEPLREDVRKNAGLATREGNYNMAVSYMEAGRADEAIKLLEALNEANPGRPRFATALAQCLFLLERFAESAEVIERMIAENGTTRDRDLILATVRFNMGRKHEALELASKLAAQDADNPRVMVLMGRVLMDMRRFPEAIEALNRAVALDESNARSHDYLAMAYLKTRRYEEAVQAALNAVSLVHLLPSGHLHLGVALAHMKEYQRAIGPLELAARMDPNLVEAHRYLATSYRALQNLDMAAEHRKLAAQAIKRRAAPKT